MGSIIGVAKGDTRSLDYSMNNPKFISSIYWGVFAKYIERIDFEAYRGPGNAVRKIGGTLAPKNTKFRVCGCCQGALGFTAYYMEKQVEPQGIYRVLRNFSWASVKWVHSKLQVSQVCNSS